MKKKLEAELISIAHRILKMKNRAELDQLQKETLNLYEKLSVLRFVEDNFNEVKPTIGYASAEEKLEDIYEKESQDSSQSEEKAVHEEEQDNDERNSVADSETKEQSEAKKEDLDKAEEKEVDEEQPEAENEKSESETDNEPVPQSANPAEQIVSSDENESSNTVPVGESPIGFDMAFEKKAADKEPEPQKEISFEDFQDYKEPEFIKLDTDTPAPESVSTTDVDFQKKETKHEESEKTTANTETTITQRSINDSAGKTINLGLNDRIAFEKHLFAGSGEDLNRVLSQLNTFGKFSDARNFINDLVKPDYNNWKDKEEYEERFMGIVEQKFD